VVEVQTLEDPSLYSDHQRREALIVAYYLERWLGHKCQHIYALPPENADARG
jgi:hypothetical protein